MDFFQTLYSRKTVRSYNGTPVTEAELQEILKAAYAAPIGRRRYDTLHLTVITDAAFLAEWERQVGMETGKEDAHPFYGAPTAVVVFEDTTNTTGHEDACMVMANLLNAAHAVGLGSCWINRGRQMFELPGGPEIKASWGLGDNMAGLAVCILGYEAEGGTLQPKPRKENYIIRA